MPTDLEDVYKILDALGNTHDLKPGQEISLSFFGPRSDGNSYYLSKAGELPLSALLERWWRNSSWQKKTTFPEYYNAASHEVLSAMSDLEKSKIDQSVLNGIKGSIDRQLESHHSGVTYYEGCHIIPYYAEAFDIGPVHFSHINDFQHSPESDLDPLSARADFVKSLHDQKVFWIARVQIPDVLAGKGEEIASMAIDLALTSIQLLCSPDQARGMRRFKSLNAPHMIVDLRRTSRGWSPAHKNNAPGLTYTGEFFTHHMRLKEGVLNSHGKRISAFCVQSPEKLNEAWCDSAYWFHEGIDEPIDTIAVAKLETSLEVLMSAESTSGSKVKILKALKLFSGKAEDDFISTGSEVTIRELSIKLVGDRSRILHGTLSTLKHDARFSRAAITQITQLLLTEVSVRLDEYKASPSYEDDHDKFLEWLIARHDEIRPSIEDSPPSGL